MKIKVREAWLQIMYLALVYVLIGFILVVLTTAVGLMTGDTALGGAPIATTLLRGGV